MTDVLTGHHIEGASRRHITGRHIIATGSNFYDLVVITITFDVITENDKLIL